MHRPPTSIINNKDDVGLDVQLPSEVVAGPVQDDQRNAQQSVPDARLLERVQFAVDAVVLVGLRQAKRVA